MCTPWVFSLCRLILFWSVVHVQFYLQLGHLLRHTPRHNAHSETYGPQLEAIFRETKTVPVTCTAWFDICKLSWSKSQLSLMSNIFSTQDPGVMEGILGTISSKVKESQHSLRQFMIFRLVKSFFFLRWIWSHHFWADECVRALQFLFTIWRSWSCCATILWRGVPWFEMEVPGSS